MTLVPKGATYGNTTWTDSFSDDHKDFSHVQKIRLKIDHTAHVYFANYDKPFTYFVIDHVRITADPGEAFWKDITDDARGFFNSSAQIAYRNVSASDNCSVRQMKFAPAGDMANDFTFNFEGTPMKLIASTGGGSGEVDFTPTETMNRDTHFKGWQIHPSSGDGWIVHQKEVWNALGKDAAGQARVDTQTLDDIFEGTPFGNVAKMPDASWYPLRCELVSMWQIEKSGGTPFTQDQREVTLTLDLDYFQRLTLFANAKNPPGFDAVRNSLALQPSSVPVKRELKLHDIAKSPRAKG